MEPDKSPKIRVSFIILAVDWSKSQLDESFLHILLDNRSIPDTILSGGETGPQIDETLSKYINSPTNTINKKIAEVLFKNDEIEIIYTIQLVLIKNINKLGSFYTPREIQNRNINIDGKYGKFFKFNW